MSKKVSALLAHRSVSPAFDLRTARLSHVDAEGVCHVLFADAKASVPASVLVGVAEELLPGAELLVAVGLKDGPVVLGAIVESLRPSVVPHKRLDLSAQECVSIECGASAILLRRDGTVVIRGKKIVSRASGENKLRGYTVKIN